MTRVFGKVCEKHPELNGERQASGRACIGCHNERTRRRKIARREQIKRFMEEHNFVAPVRAKLSSWKLRHPDKLAVIQAAAYRRLVGTREGMARRMVYKAKERAREPVAVTAQDILAVWPADDRCPVFNEPFFYGLRPNGKPTHYAPSLDRIDSAKGYVVGNIAVVSWRANKVKSDATADELEAVARWIRSL